MAGWLLRAATGAVIAFLYLPIAIIALYAFNAQRIQVWPIQEFSTQWFGSAWDNPSVRDALVLSIQVGLLSAVLAWVPYVGSVVGCVLVVCVAATDFPGQPMKIYGCILLFLSVRVLDDFVFLPLTVGRSLRLHPVLSVLMLFLGAAVAGPTGLVLVLPVLGVVAVIVETLLQIVTDHRLRVRFRDARQLKLGLRLDST